MEEVNDDLRRKWGKTLNFGIVYGKTAFGLSKQLNISEREAEQYLDKYFLRYRHIKRWMDRTAEFVKQNGYVWLRSGFKKVFPSQEGLTDHEVRSAVNAVIQGLAGHILFFGLIGCQKYLDENHCKSFLTLEVHDSILCNIHSSEMAIIPDLTNIMCEYFKQFIPDWKTPLAVDVKAGENWGEMTKF